MSIYQLLCKEHIDNILQALYISPKAHGSLAFSLPAARNTPVTSIMADASKEIMVLAIFTVSLLKLFLRQRSCVGL